MLINFPVMTTRLTSKYSVTEAISWLICPMLRGRAGLSLYLHRSEDSTPSEQIECHLSKKSIQDVFGNPGKSGSEGFGMQMA